MICFGFTFACFASFADPPFLTDQSLQRNAVTEPHDQNHPTHFPSRRQHLCRTPLRQRCADRGRAGCRHSRATAVET
ncbi:MAG: hypothetical protein CVV05_20205, partial [Gammaproteobacteria bacterium HGW-Gammaproteobacteria-1]